MSATTKQRTAQRRTTSDRNTWVCDNCRTESVGVRKRCGDCGTSRY